MADLTPLLGALDMTPAEVRAAGRRVARLRRALFAVVYVVFLALAGIETFGIIYGWQTTDWATFWAITAFPFIVVLYLFLPLTVRNPYSQQLIGAATSFHGAALAAQSTPAPTPVEPSASASESDAEPLLAHSAKYRVHRTWLPPLNPGLIILGGYLPFMGLLFAADGWASASNSEDRGPFVMFSAPPWVHAAPGALLFCIGVALWIRAYWKARPLRVRVDAQGVSWNRRRSGRARLQWSDAQAFSMMSFGGPSETSRTYVYVLDGRMVSLTWQIPPSYPPTTKPASQALCDAITRFTGLQLRDLTREAERLAATLPPTLPPKPPGVWRSLRTLPQRMTTPFGQGATPSAAPVDGAAAGETSTARRRIHPAWYPVITLFLLATVLCVGGFGAQWYQAYAYTHLVTDASSHAPLFADALAAPDGNWPLKPTRPGDDGSYAYANGAYQLTIGQNVNPAYAWAPGVYNNVVAEVSAQINANFDLSGIGLIIRNRDSQTIVAFTAVPAGDVWAYTFTDAEANSGRTQRLSIYRWSPVNKAGGAWNRFAVIVRNGIDIFVLNGHLIGALVTHDTQPVQIGVYLESTATSGAFKDFAIYRA